MKVSGSGSKVSFPRAIVDIALDIRAAGGRLYAVGGFVRDILIGLQPKDLDLVYIGISPQRAVGILQDYGEVAVDLIDNAFVVAVTIDGEQYEFAAARNEVATGQGKHDVQLKVTYNLEEDAARRDLTINALYIDIISKDVLDFFNGIEHITKGLLFPCPKFYESAERVNRVAAFASRFDFEVAWEVYEHVMSMDPYAVHPQQHYVQGWEKWGKTAVRPENGLAFWYWSKWGKKLWPEVFDVSPQFIFDIGSAYESFDPDLYPYGSEERLIYCLAILRRLFGEGVDQMLENVLAPKRIIRAVEQYDKPKWEDFKVVSNRMAMALYPDRKPGRWISAFTENAYGEACRLVDVNAFNKENIGGLVVELAAKGFYND